MALTFLKTVKGLSNGYAAGGAPFTFTPSVDLAGIANGDRVWILVVNKSSNTQVDCMNGSLTPLNWYPIGSVVSGASSFYEGGSAVSGVRFGGHVAICLHRVYTTGDVYKFNVFNSNNNTGGICSIFMFSMSGSAGATTQPLVYQSVPFAGTPTSTSSTYPDDMEAVSIPYARFAWGVMASNAVQLATFTSSSSANKYDTANTRTSGTAIGFKNATSLFAVYTGTTDANGLIPTENVTFDNVSMNSLGMFTVAMVPAVPSWPPASGFAISGNEQVGATLTAFVSQFYGDPAPTITYQWKSSTTVGGTYTNVANSGGSSTGTGTTYVPVTGDAGKFLKCVATATNTAGSSTATTPATSAITVVTNPTPGGTPPLITGNVNSGVAVVGEILSADLSGVSWTGSPNRQRQWFRANNQAMSGAVNTGITGNTYNTGPNDILQWVRVRDVDLTGGAYVESAAMKVTRLFVGTDLTYHLPVSDGAGGVIPGASLSSAAPFINVGRALAISANYVDYAITFVKNNHPDLTVTVKVKINDSTPSTDSEVDLAVSSVAASTAITAPAGVTVQPANGGFSHPVTDGTAISLGTLAAGGYRAFIQRRTVNQGFATFPVDGLRGEAFVTPNPNPS